MYNVSRVQECPQLAQCRETLATASYTILFECPCFKRRHHIWGLIYERDPITKESRYLETMDMHAQ